MKTQHNRTPLKELNLTNIALLHIEKRRLEGSGREDEGLLEARKQKRQKE